MGIRETLNEKPRLTAGVVGTVAMIATAVVVMQVFAGRRGVPAKMPDAFFTDDDGKTFFVDSVTRVPPFDHNGKQAVHANVFECDGKRFVGYMDRFNAQAHKDLLAGKPRTAQVEMYGRELKRPGEAAWVKSGVLSEEAKVTNVKCPLGHSSPEPVEPWTEARDATAFGPMAPQVAHAPPLQTKPAWQVGSHGPRPWRATTS